MRHFSLMSLPPNFEEKICGPGKENSVFSLHCPILSNPFPSFPPSSPFSCNLMNIRSSTKSIGYTSIICPTKHGALIFVNLLCFHPSWPKKPVLLSHPHPHPTKHGVTMSLLVSVAKIPATSLPITSLRRWTGAGFTAFKITESLRRGKIYGPSLRRQSRSPGLPL